jgi:hypothetical protein
MQWPAALHLLQHGAACNMADACADSGCPNVLDNSIKIWECKRILEGMAVHLEGSVPQRHPG